MLDSERSSIRNVVRQRFDLVGRFATLLIMADTISPDRRSENMRRIRSKDMTPELQVRRLLHRMGFRYRLHPKTLPGHPDIIFPRLKKAIFVHGCFWHQHADPKCRITRVPKSRLEYWGPKLERNRQRDAENISMLGRLGWGTFVVWECEVQKKTGLEQSLISFLKK